MSDTLANVLSAVRLRLNATTASDLDLLPDTRVKKYIDDVLQEVAARCRIADALVTNFVTLVASTSDYTLTTTQEYREIIWLRLQSTGILLKKISPQNMESLRVAPPGGIAKGPPFLFALYPQADSSTLMRLYPTPSTADALDALVSYAPIRVSSSADSLPLDRELLMAVELKATVSSALSLPESVREAHGLSDGLLQRMEAQAERFIKAGAMKVNLRQRSGGTERSAA